MASRPHRHTTNAATAAAVAASSPRTPPLFVQVPMFDQLSLNSQLQFAAEVVQGVMGDR